MRTHLRFGYPDLTPPQPRLPLWIIPAVIAMLLIICMAMAQADEIDDIIPCIIKIESGGNPSAVSKDGCVGLMQISPIVLKEWNVINETIVEWEEGEELCRTQRKKGYFYGQDFDPPFYTMNDMYNPIKNKRVGTWYLRRLRYYYLKAIVEKKNSHLIGKPGAQVWVYETIIDLTRELELILAAYNGGITRLRKCNYDINCMPKETRNYIKKVMKLYKKRTK